MMMMMMMIVVVVVVVVWHQKSSTERHSEFITSNVRHLSNTDHYSAVPSREA
jgi:hypothetical protein